MNRQDTANAERGGFLVNETNYAEKNSHLLLYCLRASRDRITKCRNNRGHVELPL